MGQATIALLPIAKEQVATLHNLYELYGHDFSEFVPLPIQASGRFEVTPSEGWWSSPGHHPFFIHSGAELSGFALVSRGSRVSDASDVMDIAEFFVLRGARRKQVGQRAANALFDLFQGDWEVRVRQANVPALRFWSRVIQDRAGQGVEPRALSLTGVDWWVFHFAS